MRWVIRSGQDNARRWLGQFGWMPRKAQSMSFDTMGTAEAHVTSLRDKRSPLVEGVATLVEPEVTEEDLQQGERDKAQLGKIRPQTTGVRERHVSDHDTFGSDFADESS